MLIGPVQFVVIFRTRYFPLIKTLGPVLACNSTFHMRIIPVSLCKHIYSIKLSHLDLCKSSTRFIMTNPEMPSIIFVLGPPGSGKGTQCGKIAQEMGYVHLSAGDLLREAQASDSPDGNLIKSYIKNGDIVPVRITVRLLEKAIVDSGKSMFLIDGFPRNADNLRGWTNHMSGKVNVRFVLFFEASEQLCTQRILERGKTSGRSDDNTESLGKRFRTYVAETMPIVEQYQSRGLVRTVDASGSVDQIFDIVKGIIPTSAE